MRYPNVPGSDAAHDADAARCAVCRGTHAPSPPPGQTLPPLIPARPPIGPQEIASGRGQALSVGSAARRAGWRVFPSYAMAHDGTETCLLSFARGDWRAVATWERPPGGEWGTDIAYGWVRGRPGTLTRLGIRALTSVLKGAA